MCADTPEYKDTLHLPETDFPMRAGLPKREPGWLDRWEKMGIYDRLREKAAATRGTDAERTPFTLHDGPPYANGHLHIGHALNKTIKDMIVRSHQMMGHDARYVPGWDCHGLPIEWKIEEQYRKKGRNKDDVPVIDFRQECRKFAEGWVDIQREEFKRLGVTGNWADPYLTMNFHAERVIAEEFMKFLMNGALYQGSKPVMWSPVEKTALAEAEIEYHEHQSDTIWVKFKVANARKFEFGGFSQSDWLKMQAHPKYSSMRVSGSVEGTALTVDFMHKEAVQWQADLEDRIKCEGVGFLSLDDAHVVIWTTTPWTIPSNKAVAYNPKISYGLYQVTETPDECWVSVGDKYLLADTLAADTFAKARLKDDQWIRLRDVDTAEFEGAILKHPFNGADWAEGYWDYEVPMVDGDHVTDDAGTGFVHTAPSHGADDYEVFVKRNWMDRMTHNVGEASEFLPHVPFFAGLTVFDQKGKPGKANKAVIEKLVETHSIIARGRVKHSYPHSWRSKAPVIFRNTPQWFAAIDREVGGNDTYGKTIRERALTSIDQLVKFTPQTGRNRLYSMIESRPDWVLSRQRAWGVPLTCFTKKGTLPTDPDFLLRDAAVNARIAEAFEAEGADCWYAEGAKERFLGDAVNPDDYEQVFDVLDVWFDSGSTHAFVLRDREDGTADGIADVYMEGTDQHRGWFHSSLLEACGTLGRAPYRNVVTHGFTLDAKGNKMSKSLGNTIAPADIVKQYGADILRLWVAQTDYSADQRIGQEILKGTADSYRRLRNTMRFLLGNLAGFTEDERVAYDDVTDLEKMILDQVAELDEAVREGYRAFNFQGVFSKIFNFATGELSSLYFDIRKDVLYCDPESSLARRSTRTVLDILFHRLTAWLAPVLVFTMEEVWLERFPGEDSSIHLQDFPEAHPEWKNDALRARFETLTQLRRVVTGCLEIQRREKTIGASLEAAPVLYVTEDMAALPELQDAERFADFCITSQLEIRADEVPADAFTLPDVPGVGVVFKKAEGQKCERCWKHLPGVGKYLHANVCERCDSALTEAGL